MCQLELTTSETKPPAGEGRVLVDACEFEHIWDIYGKRKYKKVKDCGSKHCTHSRALVTVNTAPERAKRLIGRLITELQDDYEIIHVDNCQSIEEVIPKVTEHKPDVLFSASMWSAEEAEQIHSMAKSIVPNIKLHAIPTGLQVERGPDAIVEYLVEKVPPLLDS
ncbi:hypothetical protein FAVG1_07820 [Fusarium avenaceum]|nr:hypothetical protein FAVG1_07820 [Fusarium avenaceum]